MGEDLVDVVDGTQLGRYVIEALQPVGIAALVEELGGVQIDEVDALVTGGGLWMAFGQSDTRRKKNATTSTHHYRQIVAVGVRQRSIASQNEILDLQKVLQVAGMVADHLCDMVQFGLIHQALLQSVLPDTRQTKRTEKSR